MWYDREHENTSLHPTLDRKRTPPDPSRLTLQRCLCLAKSPDPARLRSRRTSDGDSQALGVPQANRAQHHPWLQCQGARRLARRLFASSSTAYHLSRRSVRGPTGSAASQPPGLWPRYSSMDVILGGPDQLPTGTHFPVGFWRKYPSCPQKTRKELETGQTLDHQPRPTISCKKNARDRLIAWCSQQSGWAIGFLDEVWWSRFALPALNSWQSKDEPVRLVEQVWQKHDPDPKAFACYGVLWQQGPVTDPIRREMSLRFVDGRPVSAITTQFLEWICTRLQAGGKTGFLLSLSITPPGITASTLKPGFVITTARSRKRAKGCASCPSFCPLKVPGSTRLSPGGCMPGRRWWNPTACLPPNSWLNAFVLILAVPMNLLFLLSKRLREFALGGKLSVCVTDLLVLDAQDPA